MPVLPEMKLVFRRDGERGTTDVQTHDRPTSTFAIDGDVGSFYVGRWYLERQWRPRGVRLEEWVNAFSYGYEPPPVDDDKPFSVSMVLAPSPFRSGRQLLRIGLQARPVATEDRVPVHLVFVIDVSASMHSEMPLVQKTLHMLTDGLRDDDTVAVLSFGDEVQELLPPTPVRDKGRIHKAVDVVKGWGLTNIGDAMKVAYRTAGKQLGSDNVSRVMLFSDGQATLGDTTHTEIFESIRGYVSEGITLSTVGFGQRPYNDKLLEQLADVGNGAHAYVDSEQTAKRLFVDELNAQLVVAAKDVKVQLEFSPRWVKSHRLLGYANRALATQDFDDDKRDAGELGAGQAVTALYEVEFRKTPSPKHARRFLKLQTRHKLPKARTAVQHSFYLQPKQVKTNLTDVDDDTRWAAAVALAAGVFGEAEFAKNKALYDVILLGADAVEGPFAEERLAFLNLIDAQPQFENDRVEPFGKKKARLARREKFPVDAKRIIKTFVQNKTAVEACVKQAINRGERTPKPAKQTVLVVISPSGRVSDARFKNAVVNASNLGRCIIKASKKMKFPSFKGEAFEVEWPMILSGA